MSPILAVMLSASTVLLLPASNFHVFNRLVAEEQIAELRFTRFGRQVYEAVLRRGHFGTAETCRLFGLRQRRRVDKI